MKSLATLCFLLILPYSLSFAGEKIKAPVYKTAPQLMVAAGNIPAQIDELELAIKTDQFEELTGLERVTLTSEFLFVEKEGISADEALKSQDTINKILLTGFENSRMVCKYEAVMGSNMKQKQCETYAARNAKIKQTQLNQQRGYVPQNGAPLKTN
jgi:hypothetical protein